jgi:DNA modification methylase
MSAGDKVNLIAGSTPADYHCACKYCSQVIGELRPEDGSYYSRLERRKYYHENERGKGGHIAKTPLHIARWAVQTYTKKGDWVLDPTIGAGTTAVEAMTQGRNAAGMELEYGEVLASNLEKITDDFPGAVAKVAPGDARLIGDFLKHVDQKFKLIVNNPPYSGDVSFPSPSSKGRGKEFRALETRFDYDKNLPNLAFLKEGEEYWSTIGTIWAESTKWLKPGGHFVVGVKDMMRNKQPFFLHRDLCNVMVERVGLKFVGTAFLKHHPTTLFLNTYEKLYGVKPPLYQTISVFKKGGK